MMHDNIRSTLGLQTLPPVIERYELKYVIPFGLVAPISDFLAAYCRLDKHSVAAESTFYPVNSLYFDTPNYRFLKLRQWGIDRRFNMRVRSYGDGKDGPYFAEVKYKTPTCIRKFRATLDKEEWPHFLREDSYNDSLTDGACHDKVTRQLFLQLAASYAIEPKIFTCYRRRAFVSDFDDYARVTFDIDMRCRPQDPVHSATPFSLSPGDDCVNYDAQNIYSDETRYGECVVLELKSTAGCVPIWMLELIRRFELKQVGFSKYLNSSLVEHFDNGWDYMSPDRSGTSAVM